MTEELYREFKHDPLYEKIALHIENLVSSGKLQPGDRLPSERELAEGWGVGRGVVREAVKLLAERGLVTISPGRGTFVSELDPKFHSEQLGRVFRRGGHSYSDLHEVRKILEVEIAGLAAQKATPQDLEKMSQAIEEMNANLLPSAQVEFIKADTAFHAALAEATHNSVFPLLMDVLMDLLEEARFLMSQMPEVPARSQAHHILIFESVRQGDASAARQAMWQHTQQVAEDMEAILSVQIPEGTQLRFTQSPANE
ncbi:MAG: FadR family transcriptional regulator [Chloroflexi bacterium]|nr:FadR family transcriptional regulator [Chloroflexota bacterium]